LLKKKRVKEKEKTDRNIPLDT